LTCATDWESVRDRIVHSLNEGYETIPTRLLGWPFTWVIDTEFFDRIAPFPKLARPACSYEVVQGM